MSKIFISYSRDNEPAVRSLAEDIEALGHSVWFDQDLNGGQAWWDRILETIHNSDLFVFVLAPASLDSTACRREYGYAEELGKPILPVLVAGDVNQSLLPPALAKIQYVDYLAQDRDAIRHLAKALNTVPPPQPLPDPLPLPPDAPISYLGELAEKVKTDSTLSFEEQSALVSELRRAIRNTETTDDGRALLQQLRARRDLLVDIADEIDELLAIKKNKISQTPQNIRVKSAGKDEKSKRPTDTKRKALLWISAVAFAALVVGIWQWFVITPAMPTATLVARPSSTQLGNSIELKWKTTDATDVQITGVGSVSVSGKRQITPPAGETVYELVASGKGGVVRDSVSVTVSVPPGPPPPTASLTAVPATVIPGGTVKLEWETTNATDVAIVGIGTVTGRGSRQVNPTENPTTYKLTARGDGGSIEKRVSVEISEPAPTATATVRRFKMNPGTGFLFAEQRSTSGTGVDRDIWWNRRELVPGARMYSLGMISDTRDIIQLASGHFKFDAFVPKPGEGFGVEIKRHGETRYAIMRIISVSDDIAFEYFYPFGGQVTGRR